MNYSVFSTCYRKKSVLYIIIALFIAAVFFYWYEYRPSMARKQCSIEAEKRANDDAFVYEIVYRHCLRTQGIEYSEQ
jgi:hypothetical protein